MTVKQEVMNPYEAHSELDQEAAAVVLDPCAACVVQDGVK